MTARDIIIQKAIVHTLSKNCNMEELNFELEDFGMIAKYTILEYLKANKENFSEFAIKTIFEGNLTI